MNFRIFKELKPLQVPCVFYPPFIISLPNRQWHPLWLWTYFSFWDLLLQHRSWPRIVFSHYHFLMLRTFCITISKISKIEIWYIEYYCIYLCCILKLFRLFKNISISCGIEKSAQVFLYNPTLDTNFSA